MKTSSVGIDLVKSFEGLHFRAYLCPAGIWTIGYGHTKNVQPGDVIGQIQAEEFLKEDLVWAEDAVNELVTTTLNQNQFDALVSFVFNVGKQAFNKSTLLRLLNTVGIHNETSPLVVAEQFARWNRIGKKVSAGLTRRRAAERDLFLSAEPG